METAVARTNNLAVTGLCLLAAMLVVLIGVLPPGGTTIAISLVVVLAFVCALPAIIGLVQRRREPFVLINLVCLVSFIQLGLGTLYLLYDPRAAYDPGIMPWIPKALVLSCAGIFALLLGWRMASNLLRPLSRAVRMETTGTVWIVILYAAGLCGQFATLQLDREAELSGAVNLFLSLILQFSAIATAIFFFLLLRLFLKRATKAETLFLFAVVIPTQAVALVGFLGNKSFCITLLGLPFIAYRFARGKLPSLLLVPFALLIVFVIFPFFNTYRNTSSSYSLGTRVSETIERLTATAGSVEDYQESSIHSFGTRIALINSVAIIIRETGSTVDFQQGKTLVDALTGILIPRIVWPDKPVVGLGREFSRQFHVQPRWDDKTWVAPTIIGELYWNFGVVGVIIGMLALGSFLRLVYRQFGEAGVLDPVNLSLYAGILVPLLVVEASIGSYLGGVIKIIISFAAIQWMLQATGYCFPVPNGPAPGSAAPAGV